MLNEEEEEEEDCSIFTFYSSVAQYTRLRYS